MYGYWIKIFEWGGLDWGERKKKYYIWVMNTLRVEILHPKAEKLLEDLADLNLISITSNAKGGFAGVLQKLRSKSASAPSLDEITKEVELVRAKRYAK